MSSRRVLSWLWLVSLPSLGGAQADAVPDAARQQELASLVLQDCGSCHGMTLQGGLGPALTAERLGHTPDAALIDTILLGRSGTPMPPWQGLLDRAEAAWIVQQLKAGSLRPPHS